MNVVNLIQNSPEWHAHRAMHWNASDAPVMLGVSPYRSRADLLRERATGAAFDVDPETQRLYDRGHRAESLARPLAEKIVGEDLYPCVGADGDLSASFDGITMDGTVVWEHKLLGKRLRDAFNAIEEVRGDGSMLPEHYRAQMEQQLLVSGASRVLFMASVWDRDGNLIEECHCWYEPDMALRDRIVAGWQQFAADLAAYEPAAAEKPAAVGRSPETLPALNVQATGTVLASNLDQFREHAMAVLSGINRDLQTDDDFADAEKAVKWCGDVEQRLAAAKANVLGQMESVDAVCRTIDEISAETRRIRLELDKLVKAEKEARKEQIIRAGADAVRAHYDAINATLGEHRIQPPQSLQMTLGAAMKSLRTLASMRDKIDAAVAQEKITASQQADRIRANVAVLAEHQQHSSLFADRVTLCATKQPEDLRNLVSARIADHERQQAAKLEAERERIRAEEAARIEREQRETELKAAAAATEDTTPAAEVSKPAPAPVHSVPVAADRPGTRIKLGEINAAIAPLSITADGLAQLGIHSVGHEKAAKLYDAADFPRVIAALQRLLISASLGEKAAA